MGLNKPIIISTSAVDTSNLATKSDMTTLQNSVTSALANVGGAVKSVQRGVACKSSSSKNYVDVTISNVDTTKSIALLTINGGSVKNDFTAYGTSANTVACKLLNNTTLRVTASYTSSDYGASWVVIEFY